MARPMQSDSQFLARANEAFHAGRYAEAAKLYESANRRQPSAALLQHLGLCRGYLGEFDRARQCLEKAAKLQPTADTYTNLAISLQMDGRFDEAHAAFDHALELGPSNDNALSRKGLLLRFQREAERSFDFLQPHVEGDRPPPMTTAAYAGAAKSLGRLHEGVEAAERCLRRDDLTDEQRCTVLFALGDLRDAQCEYAAAFDAYRQGNALKKTGFSPEAHAAQVNQLIASWTAEAHQAAQRSRVRNDRPVFIVGMPRSGTSLVEQILAAHPQVHGGGETNAIPLAMGELCRRGSRIISPAEIPAAADLRSLNAATQSCIRHLGRNAGSVRRVTDKMPTNFEHLGAIALMLPQARIIHCVRDPLDTCLSCYFHDFAGPNSFAYDLGHLGAYYRDYHRLIEHWKSVIDIPLTDVVYEDLIENQEAESRRLIEFLGLEWDDACLRFHESKRITVTASSDQVQRPIYRSSAGRHRHYEQYLAPLRAALGV